VSPGYRPVWSELDGHTIPGIDSCEHTQPAEAAARLPWITWGNPGG
jgi:hypothetical protein